MIYLEDKHSVSKNYIKFLSKQNRDWEWKPFCGVIYCDL